MSKGICGCMYLVDCDSTALMYSYCCYNLNLDDWKKYRELADGEIIILREALVEPEIHRKLRKMPSGRKRLIEKRVRRDVDWTPLFDGGMITVKNASGTWCTDSQGMDIMAFHLLFKLFNDYQDTGEIPEKVDYFC